MIALELSKLVSLFRRQVAQVEQKLNVAIQDLLIILAHLKKHN